MDMQMDMPMGMLMGMQVWNNLSLLFCFSLHSKLYLLKLPNIQTFNNVFKNFNLEEIKTQPPTQESAFL